MTRILRLMMAGLLVPALAWAGQTSPFAGGVPTDNVSPTPLHLALSDAIARGLEHNLGVILEQQQVRASGSSRLQALSELVPHLSGTVRESRQIVSLAAFGFTGFGDIVLPSLVGPFNVFDARVAFSTPIVDIAAWQRLHAATASESAARADYRQARETVVLAVGNLYLLALADQARVASAEAQVATADSLVRLADDRHSAGLVPQIDVVRQQVQLQGARSQQISASAALANRKLQLARAIGLPAGQQFDLTTTSAFVAAQTPGFDDALKEAEEHRPEVVSARARVEAARAARKAAVAGSLPSLHVDADVGAIGTTTGSAEPTYTVAAALRVPIFAGGQRRADVQRADADLHQREAELADLENGLHYEIESALLTLNAASAGVDVAASAASLSRDELTQAQDRFAAGVAGTIEVVQAQEAVARASEQYIASVYAHTIAKAALARAMGDAETKFLALVGGQP
ncbi:MAG: TolC family protein [Acidobacteriota bacterium]